MPLNHGRHDRPEGQRNQCRRPIKPEEVPDLERLGKLLRDFRHAAGLTQLEVQWLSRTSRVQIARIEAGTRRTRASTLHRIAAALALVDPSLGRAETLSTRLRKAAGQAIAPESQYRARVDRRRGRRARKGRYGPRIESPRPGETFKAYLRRLASVQSLPAPGVDCPHCGAELVQVLRAVAEREGVPKGSRSGTR